MEYKIAFTALLVAAVCLTGITINVIGRFEHGRINASDAIALPVSTSASGEEKSSHLESSGSASTASIAVIDYPHKSPFSAVRWNGDVPVIRINRQPEWYGVISIDGLTTDQIIEFCKAYYRTKWKEAFEADLMEVFARKGHPLGSTTTLLLIHVDTKEPLSISNAPISFANQNGVYAYRATANGMN